MKLFSKTIDRQLFKQYALGSDLSKQEVVVKIFNPQGRGNWFILNSDPEDPDYLWAIVDLGYGAEVGSVSRSDLETYRGKFGLGFERDLSFDPVNAEELYKGLRQGKYYDKGGEVSFIDYNESEIMYEPHNKKYYANDVEFDSLKEAKDFIDSGEISADIRDAYSKGLFADGGNLRQSLEEVLKQDITFLKFDSGRAYEKFSRLDIPFINVHDYDFNHYCIIETKNLEKVLDNVSKGVRVVKKKFSSDDLGFDYKGSTSFAEGGNIGKNLRIIEGHRYVLDRYKELSRGEFVPANLEQYWNVFLDKIIDNEYVKVSGFYKEKYFTMVVKKSSLLPFSNKKFADGGNIENFSDNQQMIMNQNVELEHHHEELEDILEDEMPVPAWVVAKMATATQSISDVTHYLDGEKELMKDENEEEDEDEDEDEIENREVVEPINVSAGTKAEMTKKFTDDAMGNLKGFLKGMEGVELRDDYTFDYNNEQYEIEPIINSDENSVSNAVFTIFDGDGEEVGEVAYSRKGGKQKFTANSEFFGWDRAKFEDGGFMNGVYADGGYFDGTIPKVSTYMSNYAKGGEVAKAEVFGLSKNIMGTTDIEMKISGMRKAQDFIVYPIGKDDAGSVITIQSETRIGKIDLTSGRGLMSQSHSNGAYFVHFQMDKLTPFTVSESDLENIKSHIFKTDGANVGTRGIVSDNSGASGIYAKGGILDAETVKIGDWLQKKENKAKAKVFDIKKDRFSTDIFVQDLYENKVSRPIDLEDWKKITEPTRQLARIEKMKQEFAEEMSYAKGGVTYFNNENQHRLSRPSGSFEKEIFDKVRDMIDADSFVGSFGWRISSGKKAYMADGFLYKLDAYDQNLIKNLRLKQGEKVFRYVNRTTAIGGMMPFIKINIEKALLYFPLTNENDEILFETKGVTPLWINLIEGSFAEGGSVAKDVVIQKSGQGEFTVWHIIDSKSPFSYSTEVVFDSKEEATKFANKKGFNIVTEFENEYAEGGIFEKVKWQDVQKGDSARVKELNRMGMITSSYGRKFNLQFPNGTEKTFDASDLEFFKLEKDQYKEDNNNNYAKGGMVVTSIKDIPDFEEKLNQRKITYRGLGMGKLFDDFYKLAGTSGTRIKVDGKEYFITDEEFNTFSRDADGKMRIRFEAPVRKAEGGSFDKPFDVAYKTKSGKGMVALRIMAKNEEEAKQKLIKQMRSSDSFDKVYLAHPSFEDGGFMNDVYAEGGDVGNVGTTQIKKDPRGNWRAENNIADFNGYDWRLSTLKTYSGQLISAVQGGKSEKGNGYTTFKYTMYEDPYHTLEVSKPTRFSEKVVTEQHEKALAKFKKFMETGMFRGGGQISKFDKLSDKVAKEYEGKPVKSKYQEEYGKYYSKEEAQEVGDKVAGKVKAMQTDSKAFGGLFSSAKQMVTPKKYPELEGKQVPLKSGKFVQVLTQSGGTLYVIELGKLGTGIKPHTIDISEVDLTKLQSGGSVETKKP